MPKKLVYNPDEHAKNNENLGSKKVTEKDIVYPPPAITKTKEPAKAKAKETTEKPVKEFKTKLNKYGFLHISKKAVKSLPFKPEEPLTARVEGKTLVIAATTENQPEE